MCENDTFINSRSHYFVTIRTRCAKQEYLIPDNAMFTNRFSTVAPKKENPWQAKTEFVINSLDAIIWEYDLETDRFLSDSVDFILGEGKNFEEYIAIHHPNDRAALRRVFDKLTSGSTDCMQLDVRLRHSDNSYLWMQTHVAVIDRTKKGFARRIIGLHRDIQELMKAQDQLIENKRKIEELVVLRDQAEEANQLKTAFFANMSHEIRTPLNAILGFSNLIVETAGDESLAEYAKMIAVNNELLTQLINDVLDLSRIEAGKLDFNMSEISVNELMEQFKQMFQLRAQSSVEVIFDTPPVKCSIVSEHNRLRQVITNFLSNAIKYTMQGSIHLGYELRPSGLYFYVTDTGKGIAKENVPLVFNRFTKFDYSVQGTGLGLSICKMIIDRLGGEIGAESTLGKGSKFWFALPCKVTTY